jgi:LuxR family transcriptional activator of conjugal transfer of Ti plasmids
MVDTVERDESIRRFTEEAIYFGIRCGFTVPLHVGFGGTTALSLTSAKPQSPPIEFRDFGPALTAAAFAHINLLRLTERIEEGIAAKLSPRETICLKWAALGMTKKDTAAIIGLSEKTVRFYLDNVVKKLAARNITQAVAIATDKYLI